MPYPCVFRHRDGSFMNPETPAMTRVDLYHAYECHFVWQREKYLIEGVTLVNVGPFFMEGVWSLFTTTLGAGMETLLFYSTSLHSKWTYRPQNWISSDVRRAGSAGHLFWRNGKLLGRRRIARATTDTPCRSTTCSSSRRRNPESADVSGSSPHWRAGLLGTHTLNGDSGVEFSDGIALEA